MTQQQSTPVSPVTVAVRRAAEDLLTGLLAEPWGQLSPSVYETARLVASGPGLPGHPARLRFLLDSQRPDGGWGGPAGYALVPTLSATEALLAELARPGGAFGQRTTPPDNMATVDRHSGAPEISPVAPRAELVGAAHRGLHALFGWAGQDNRMSIPDTPAIEIIIPALVESVNALLRQVPDVPVGELRGRRLALPGGVDPAALAAVRAGLAAGHVPEKLLHSFEVLGPAGAPGLAGAVPTAARAVPGGGIGASPAATAAWLAGGGADPDGLAAGYLRDLVARTGGPVPSVTPITMFERAWVLNALCGAGLGTVVPVSLVGQLAAGVGERGTGGGAGLPHDADTTGGTLFALAQLGRPVGAGSLWGYQRGEHFCAWPGERTASPSLNAHVIEALLGGAAGPAGARAAAAVARTGRWLVDQQSAQGAWTDKWHASPYYATACCALALHRAGTARGAVDRALDWILSTQEHDGSWGRWGGTAEETAYAVQTLLICGRSGADTRGPVASAAANGCEFLRSAASGVLDTGPGGQAGQDHYPPLWHDKDLYTPTAVVRANILAALHLAGSDPAVLAATGGHGGYRRHDRTSAPAGRSIQHGE